MFGTWAEPGNSGSNGRRTAGMPVAEMTATLTRYSRFDLPKNVLRDVADLHVRAMTASEAAGERFLALGEDFRWVSEMGEWLREALPELVEQGFVALLDAAGLPTITVDAALAWAQGPDVDPASSIAPNRA